MLPARPMTRPCRASPGQRAMYEHIKESQQKGPLDEARSGNRRGDGSETSQRRRAREQQLGLLAQPFHRLSAISLPSDRPHAGEPRIGWTATPRVTTPARSVCRCLSPASGRSPMSIRPSMCSLPTSSGSHGWRRVSQPTKWSVCSADSSPALTSLLPNAVSKDQDHRRCVHGRGRNARAAR